jgi:hypothetical protein
VDIPEEIIQTESGAARICIQEKSHPERERRCRIPLGISRISHDSIRIKKEMADPPTGLKAYLKAQRRLVTLDSDRIKPHATARLTDSRYSVENSSGRA